MDNTRQPENETKAELMDAELNNRTDIFRAGGP